MSLREGGFADARHERRDHPASHTLVAGLFDTRDVSIVADPSGVRRHMPDKVDTDQRPGARACCNEKSERYLSGRGFGPQRDLEPKEK